MSPPGPLRTGEVGLETVICPKCGFKQDQGAECLRCGLIFERYRLPCHPAALETPAARPRRTGPVRRAFRCLRWAALGAGVLVLLLIFRPSPPPEVQTEPGAARRAEMKVREFQAAARSGRPATLRLDEAELNSWVQSNLAFRTDHPAAEGIVQAASGKEPTVEEVQSNVRDVRLQLQEDLIKAYVLFDFHGKELSLTLEGHLRAEDGYLRLTPTAGRLGSLPLTAATLESAAARLFDSPENREKFRLPAGIEDVRVERGRLSVVSR